MVITDLPVKVPGLGACAACVAGKSVHLPRKEGRKRASEYLERAHGTRLSAADFPTSQEEKDDMATRPYRELMGALAWLALGA